MSTDSLRSVSLRRTAPSRYLATNPRGGELPMGDGSTAEFTPVELLLAAVAGCSAVDVDLLTSRLAEPDSFELSASGRKVRDEGGNHLESVEVHFTVRFPAGEDGERARERLPGAVAQSRDRLCTVSRTVALPVPVVFHLD
jgi:putative redox protein